MSSSPLRSLVEHEVRLEMLSRLDGESLTVPQVSERTGRPKSHVEHHMHLLETFGLVSQTGEVDGQPLYVARLRKQPAWVARAVNAHRERTRVRAA